MPVIMFLNACVNLCLNINTMEIHIDRKRRLSDIQEDFKKRFPYLKVEFFTSQGAGRKENMIDARKTVGELSDLKDDLTLKINGLMTVTEVEKMIKDNTGLHAEVFRKSGKVWLRTSATDSWTLDEQNHEAREAEVRKDENPEQPDYHEQE